MLRYYLQELFEPTLLYSLALAVLGISAAYYYGRFSIYAAALVIIGSVMAQISVNVISDYFDYASGLDKELAKSKSGNLAGGSSLLARGLIKPGYTLAAGLAVYLFAATIGIYFLIMQIQLLPILVVASLSILLYARFAKKVPYLSEPLCTLNYVLIAFGSFIVVAGFNQLSHALIFSLVPAGIMLGGNSLFINEIPDRGVDRKYGVKHSAVMLKTSKRIALYYLSFQAAAYLILVSGLILRQLPPAAAVALATLPITPYIFYGIYNARTRKYGRYLAFQTAASFIFAVLLSVVYIVAV